MRKVYIQKVGNRIASENSFLAALGFSQLGYAVIEVDEESLQVKLIEEPTAIVVGGTKFLRKAFSILKIEQPKVHNPHICLPEYVGRDICEATLEEVKTLTEFPFFIKPLDSYKLFTGYVINSPQDFMKIASIPLTTKILLSECVEFVSEYRCFVLNGNMVGAKNYKGDFKLIPDFKIIENAIQDYHEQPTAYSIDFGITKDGRTLLIEMNDGFGLGAYGLDKIIYCKILQTRWDEIVKPYK